MAIPVALAVTPVAPRKVEYSKVVPSALSLLKNALLPELVC
jgi:hypothetical protein